MQITTFLIDWTEATERAEEGTLAALVYGGNLEDEEADIAEEEEEEDEDMAEEDELDEEDVAGSLWSDNYTLYSQIADCYAQFSEGLDSSLKQRTDRFFNALISRDPVMELKSLKMSDGWLMSLAPETVAELAGLTEEIDFKELKKAFNAKCNRDIKRALADHAKLPDPNRAFDLVVMPYLESWVELLCRGADEEKGLLAMVG